MKIRYSIVIPFYNEEGNVCVMVDRVSAVLNRLHGAYEIIAVDDGSRDATFSRLRECKELYPCLKIIKFRRNFGQTQAMQAGIDYASGDIIITMDGDLQNDPEDIPNLLEKMEQGFDVVCGWRKKRKDSILRCIPSIVANYVLALVTGVKIHDTGCSLKVYKANLLKKVHLYSEMHRFIPAFASLQGARIGELVVAHHPRQRGASKYGFSRIWQVQCDLFTLRLILNFSQKPMVWFGGAAFISLICALVLFVDKVLTPYFQPLVIWPGAIIFLVVNALIFIGYGLICELALRVGNHG